MAQDTQTVTEGATGASSAESAVLTDGLAGKVKNLKLRLETQVVLASNDALENYGVFKEGVQFALNEVLAIIKQQP